MSNVITGKVRFSYVYVFEPRKQLSGDEKYSVTLLIPKSDVTTYNKIMAEMNKCLDEAVGKTFNGVRPANPAFPIYDGDGLRPGGEAFGEECRGCWVITANSNERVDPVDINRNKIFNKSDFYSGCYGHASIKFYAYNKNGKKGVGCGLCNLMKTEDGQPLNGRTTAEEDFAELAKPGGLFSSQVTQPQYAQVPQQAQQAYNPITGQPVQNIYGIQ